MKEKRLNPRSLLLTCWCLLLSTIFVSETLALIKVSSLSTSSTTLPTAQLLLADEFRAGAFGSHDAADNDEDMDESESKPKGKQNNNNNNSNNNNDNDNATVEEYVAAMRERDAGQDSVAAVMDDNKDNNSDASSSSSPSAESEDSAVSATTTTLESQDNDTSMGDQESGSEESSVVGVKSHKKSNAVGDPDDDDDDDDGDISDDEDDDDDVDDVDDIDDENDSQSEYSEEWEEIEETFDQYTDNTISMFEPQVEVGVEMVEEEGIMDHRHVKAKTKGGGGVGVRLGRIANRRKNNRRKTEKTETLKPPSYDRARLLRAWNPFFYLPPTPSALSFLSDNARLLDSSSKNRLDRRTLYAGLLLEWGATDSKLSSSTRKFLPAESSQALQAALSLATQPQWRQTTPRTSGIRLYSDDENAKGSTLGMQETIAMSLVSCFLKLW
jgi:hypothetical protein